MLGIGNQIIVYSKRQSYIVLFNEIFLRVGDVAYEECAYFMDLFIEISDSDMGDIDERLHLEIFLDVVNRNSHLRGSDELRQF